jgi:Arc/MetJ-type ribon-helix-helix transcriptional regulator
MRVHVNLPDDLVRDVDELAGRGKRSEYIADLLTEALKRERRVRLFEEGAGILTDENYPHFSTPEKIAAWFKGLRETPSIRRDPIAEVLAGFERGDELAQGKGTGAKPGRAPRAKPLRNRT